jgi:hypothetical protein
LLSCANNLISAPAARPGEHIANEYNKHGGLEPAVVVREASPAIQLASQDDQLMSKHCILRLKPDVRLEWRGQHGQNEADQRDHCANLADSIIR